MKVACSAAAVDRNLSTLEETTSSELSHFENEKEYLPALGSPFGAGPMLVDSRPGPTWRDIPVSCTAHARTLAVERNMVLGPVLVLRTPCFCRCSLRSYLYYAGCSVRDLSFC